MKTHHALCGLISVLLILLASNLHASILTVFIKQTPDPTTSVTFNGGSVSNLGTLTWTITTDTTNPDLDPGGGFAAGSGIFAVSSVTLLAPGLGINTATAVTSSGLAFRMFSVGNQFIFGYPGSGTGNGFRAGHVFGHGYTPPFTDVNDLSTWTGATGPFTATSSQVNTAETLSAPLTLANGDLFDAGQVADMHAGSGTASVTFNPEPSHGIILAMGGLASVVLRRRRR